MKTLTDNNSVSPSPLLQKVSVDCLRLSSSKTPHHHHHHQTTIESVSVNRPLSYLSQHSGVHQVHGCLNNGQWRKSVLLLVREIVEPLGSKFWDQVCFAYPALEKQNTTLRFLRLLRLDEILPHTHTQPPSTSILICHDQSSWRHWTVLKGAVCTRWVQPHIISKHLID